MPPSSMIDNLRKDWGLDLASTLFEIGRMLEDAKDVQRSVMFYQQALQMFSRIAQADSTCQEGMLFIP